MHACFGFTNNTCTYKFMEETTLISNDPYISMHYDKFDGREKVDLRHEAIMILIGIERDFKIFCMFQNSFHPWKHQCMGYIVSISSFKALVGFQNINLPSCIY